jgi:hypothetical protein
MFERELKELNPDKRDLMYDIKDLHAYIDRMADITALVYASSTVALVALACALFIRKHVLCVLL